MINAIFNVFDEGSRVETRQGMARSSVQPDKAAPTSKEVFGELGRVLLATSLFVAIFQLGLWAAGIR